MMTCSMILLEYLTKKEEIAEIASMRIIVLNTIGNTHSIVSLKEQLGRKIRERTQEIKIKVQYGEKEECFRVKVN